MKPLDTFFGNLGNSIIRLCDGLVNAGAESATIEALRDDLADITDKVRKEGSVELNDKLTNQLNRLAELGDQINASEGIVFKELADYREELLKVYKSLKPMGLSKRTIQSIEDVTNPLMNSINEKCARIRAAFVKEFDESLAKNYYIIGERGEAKRITLPRDLVVWEAM